MTRQRNRRPPRSAMVALVVIGVALVTEPAVVAVTNAARPAPVSVPMPEIQRILDAFVARADAPGAVLALQVHGAPAVIFTTGSSDPRTAIPMRAEDAFYVASVTKTFVGALALKLVDQRKLRLDTPINDYLGDWPHGDRITVRELLNHSSGLAPLGGDRGSPDQYSSAFQSLILANLTHRFTPEEILALVRDRPLLFAPGRSVSYSNINTILLGQIIAKVTGTTIGTALRSQLFEPLKLHATTYAAEESPATPPVHGVFRLGGQGDLLDTAAFNNTGLLTALGASGAIVSNSTDLVRWASTFYRHHSILKPSTAARAFRIGAGGTGLGVLGFGPSGYCVFTDEGCPPHTDFPAIGGSGSIPGTSTTVLYDRPSDTVLVLLVNRNDLDVTETVQRVLRIVAQAQRRERSGPRATCRSPRRSVPAAVRATFLESSPSPRGPSRSSPCGLDANPRPGDVPTRR